MKISDEQLKGLKEQIIHQIKTTFPEDKKNSAISNINSMEKEEFIEFLKKNKLINSQSEEDKETPQRSYQNESPFRLIIENKVPFHKIDENKYCLAVLEINPISKGHAIIIPKKAISESSKIPQPIFSLAKRVSKKIKTKLKPREVSISSINSLGEIVINILPIYDKENMSSPRMQISEDELKDLKKKLEKKQRTKISKKPRTKKIKESKIWLPKRMP